MKWVSSVMNAAEVALVLVATVMGSVTVMRVVTIAYTVQLVGVVAVVVGLWFGVRKTGSPTTLQNKWESRVCDGLCVPMLMWHGCWVCVVAAVAGWVVLEELWWREGRDVVL